MRPGPHYGLFQRHAVNAYVQETADHRAYRENEEPYSRTQYIQHKHLSGFEPFNSRYRAAAHPSQFVLQRRPYALDLIEYILVIDALIALVEILVEFSGYSRVVDRIDDAAYLFFREFDYLR